MGMRWSPFAESMSMVTPGVLRYVTEDGQTFFITPRSEYFDVKALGHRELVEVIQGNATVTLRIRNVNVTPGNIEDDLPLTASLSIKTEPIYGLVDGGWLPMPWAHKRIALLDSNMVITVEKMISGRTPPIEAMENFLGLDVQRVSSILYALEGVYRRTVTEAEFNEELNRAEASLKGLLPVDKVETLDAAQRAGVYDMLRHQSRDATAELVKAVVPKIVDQISKDQRRKIETEVLELAAAHHLSVNRLVVLALLSCVYDGGRVRRHKVEIPGRAVIKPKRCYDGHAAYSAIADLYMLEFLHNIQALFPDNSTVFYTQDVGLAAMWTAMQPCQRTVTKNLIGHFNTKITFPLDGGLFPALSPDETLELKHRLLEFSERQTVA